MPIRNLTQEALGATRLSASYCVIGAGPAGLAVATRLAAAGKHVVVLESGFENFTADTHALNAIETRGAPYPGAMTGRYRGLGGSTSRWGGMLIPLAPHELAPRPYLSHAGWPLTHDVLRRYDGEIARIFHLGEVSFAEEALAAADPERLFQHDPDFNTRWVKVALPRQRKLQNLVAGVRDHKGPDVWLGATVTGFDLDKTSGRLLAVQARSLMGHCLTASANMFILAAGTIETTRLLLLLDEHSGGQAFAHCQALGRYYQDHLDVKVGHLRPLDHERVSRLFGIRFERKLLRRVHLELSPAAQAADHVSGAFAHVELNIQDQPSLSLLARKFEERQPRFSAAELMTLWAERGIVAKVAYSRLANGSLPILKGSDPHLRICIEQAPHVDNRLVLSREKDALGVPKACLRWRPIDLDERTFRACSDRLRAFWSRSGLSRLCHVVWDPIVTNPALHFIPHARDYYHPSGTTRMGTNPRTSVVNPDLRCHFVPNLHVVSASTFPTAGVSNPTLTLMQLALRCADHLCAFDPA